MCQNLRVKGGLQGRISSYMILMTMRVCDQMHVRSVKRLSQFLGSMSAARVHHKAVDQIGGRVVQVPAQDCVSDSEFANPTDLFGADHLFITPEQLDSFD